MSKREDIRWVSCSVDMGWSVSQSRHLAYRGSLDTLCGASASHADIWRGNTTKPECTVCRESNVEATK